MKLLFLLILLMSLEFCSRPIEAKQKKLVPFHFLYWDSDFMTYSINPKLTESELIRASFVLDLYGFENKINKSGLWVDGKVYKDTNIFLTLTEKINDTAWLKYQFNHMLHEK